ncbi:MAG: transglycosylase domain-containing protein, partial [Proteobacteria bacterium]|nr:transglycosylase domain-containing protein [Pseudomonadota bacterium]
MAARPIQVLKGMLLVPLVIIAALALIWRVLPPISTLMVWQTITGGTVRRTYVPLERISPRLVAAVINAEDARFCHHIGVDWHELGKVLETDGGPRRGASTLTMQTAKNLFLWQSPLTYLRKGLEIPLALGLDLTWPKRRVIEVYLNVAEWGDGIFGAEAAARAHFGKSAAELSAR